MATKSTRDDCRAPRAQVASAYNRSEPWPRWELYSAGVTLGNEGRAPRPRARCTASKRHKCQGGSPVVIHIQQPVVSNSNCGGLYRTDLSRNMKATAGAAKGAREETKQHDTPSNTRVQQSTQRTIRHRPPHLRHLQQSPSHRRRPHHPLRRRRSRRHHQPAPCMQAMQLTPRSTLRQ